MPKNQTNKLDLLAIGEAMAELRNGSPAGSRADFKVGFAGDTYNTAVYCNRTMGEGAKVGFFTRVGQDPLSTEFVVSCLLYTSPSPRDLSTSRMPSSA